MESEVLLPKAGSWSSDLPIVSAVNMNDIVLRSSKSVGSNSNLRHRQKERKNGETCSYLGVVRESQIVPQRQFSSPDRDTIPALGR